MQFDDVGTSDALGWARGWTSSGIVSGGESGDEELVDAEDRLEPLHPIFVIPWTAVDRCSQHFSQKTGF